MAAIKRVDILKGVNPVSEKRKARATWVESSLLLITAKCRREELKMRRPNALAIRVLLSTGVRGAELFTVQWKDVHLDEGR